MNYTESKNNLEFPKSTLVGNKRKKPSCSLPNKKKSSSTNPKLDRLVKQLKEFCKQNRLAEARENLKIIIKEYKELPYPNVNECNKLLESYCCLGLLDKARELISEMKEKHPQCRPNRFSYTCLLKGYCKRELMDSAESLLEQMENCLEIGSSLNDIPYNILMNAYCKKGFLEKAKDLFKKMREHPNINCQPTITSYNILLKSYCEKHLIEDAESFLQDMENNPNLKLNVISYTTLLKVYCNENLIEKAQALWKKMEESQNPEQRPNQFSYGVFLKYYCDQGLMDKAEEILRAMESSDCKPDSIAYSILMNGYCNLDRTEDVSRVFNIIGQKKLLTKSAAHIFVNFIFEKHEEEAEKAYQLAELQLKEEFVDGELHLDLHGFTKGSAWIAIKNYLATHPKLDRVKFIPGKGKSSTHDIFDLSVFLQSKLQIDYPNSVICTQHDNEGILVFTKRQKSGIDSTQNTGHQTAAWQRMINR